MFTRIKLAVMGAASSIALLGVIAPAAHAGLLSGPCGQPLSQPFASFGDSNEYAAAPGGNFESGASGWKLTGGAAVVSGNESYNIVGGSHSLRLPAGSSASSPAQCTGINYPSMRFFVRNTGSSTSRLRVYATITPILGLLPILTNADLGYVTGSGTWKPSSVVGIPFLSNLAGTLNLGETKISFKFVPADNTGNWQIDDVYLDPFCRA